MFAYLVLLWKAWEQLHTFAVLRLLKQAWAVELACQKWRLLEQTLCCLAAPGSEHDWAPALQTQQLLEYLRPFAARSASKQTLLA